MCLKIHRHHTYRHLWELSVRTANVLLRADVVPDYALFLSREELLAIRDLGDKSIAEILQKRRQFLDALRCPQCGAKTLVTVRGLFRCVDCEGFSVEELYGIFGGERPRPTEKQREQKRKLQKQ